MKKIWVLLVLWLGFGAFASAQTGIGIRGAANLARMDFAITPTPGLRLPNQEFVQGFEAGLVGRLMNNKHLGFQAELNYSKQGWLIYSGTELVHEKEFEYIQLPILTHVQLGGGNFKFTLHGGAFMGYLLEHTNVLGPNPEIEAPIVYEQQPFRPWQYGILGGGGPAYQFPFGMLQLEVRYVHHLSNLLEADFSRSDDFDGSSPMTITFGMQWVYMF